MNIDWDKLYLAYDWAKEWQVLLAGLLVLLAALIIAWATIRAAKMGATSRPESKSRSDLRREPTPASSPPGPSVSTATSGELISSLEQLRSLIRSALSSLPATNEKENNPANFLCQRILHLRLDQLPPPAHAGKAAQEGLSTLQKQLSTLRTHLKKDASPAELSEILVQINSSARSLVIALGPASEKRRQAGQDTR
ncbi:MAG: hypothetical protein ABI608_00695 [Rhizomicrobium sp.]